MLSAFLASSAKLTGNRNNSQASAIIISGYFLKETAFSTSFKSARQMETLMCTKLKTDFLQSKTFINNCFLQQDKKCSTIQFFHSHSQHLRFLQHLPIFFNSHLHHPCRISLAPLAAALTRTEHLTLLDLFLLQVLYRD